VDTTWNCLFKKHGPLGLLLTRGGKKTRDQKGRNMARASPQMSEKGRETSVWRHWGGQPLLGQRGGTGAGIKMSTHTREEDAGGLGTTDSPARYEAMRGACPKKDEAKKPF